MACVPEKSLFLRFLSRGAFQFGQVQVFHLPDGTRIRTNSNRRIVLLLCILHRKVIQSDGLGEKSATEVVANKDARTDFTNVCSVFTSGKRRISCFDRSGLDNKSLVGGLCSPTAKSWSPVATTTTAIASAELYDSESE